MSVLLDPPLNTHTYWKVFEKGMKMHMRHHVKVCSLTTYHVVLAKFGEHTIDLHALKLTLGFQHCLAPLLVL